ncbi:MULTISPECIES: TIGR03767 family metallophosphoesterase [unclassified Luteococcus]|uniref:TIGR03767 family metallophosphoesterase n=1 Tax=unclassified Luteococcus TaxID=2639923 RepID=UPI00313CA42F
MTRRNILLGSGLAALAVGSGELLTAPQAQARGASTAGTTLQQAATGAATGYSRLSAGPGYPLVVRDDLAAPQPGREDRRLPLASLVQLTDLHFVDAQSPMRVEWFRKVIGSAFRPQESLGTRANTSLVEAINSLARGPWSGRRFDAVVCTGDNTDNQELIELDWYLKTLSGGQITPNTGDPARWEGVQTRNTKSFWTPESSIADEYKQAGFPQIDGFFSRVMATHSSPGLKTPWYAVFGNHDNSAQGTFPASWKSLTKVYTGNQKLVGYAEPTDQQAAARALSSGTPVDLSSARTLSVTVTADPRRRPFTPTEFMAAHLDSSVTGPGPVGHGFTRQNVESGAGYYTFQLAPGITGIAMDSTNRAGFTEGSIDDRQWKWLLKTLQAGSSVYHDAVGGKHTQQVSDQLFVLFSHHTSGSMNNLMLPADGTGIRHAGFELVDMLKRFPNVLAWVNGHTHANKITAHQHRDPKRGFYEINTASHIDFPQLARVIEFLDNADGTLSMFTTLVESAAPYQADYDTATVAGMASLSREFAYNDPERDLSLLGAAGDRNTELVMPHPLR